MSHIFVHFSISLHIEPETLVAIVGPIGAGKSSFISSILGEMYKLSGSVTAHVC